MSATERQIPRIVRGGYVVRDEIGVATIQICPEAVHRSRDAKRLFTERVRVLIFNLERKTSREATACTELQLFGDRITTRLAVRDGSERLIWTARLNITRSGNRIVDVDVA